MFKFLIRRQSLHFSWLGKLQRVWLLKWCKGTKKSHFRLPSKHSIALFKGKEGRIKMLVKPWKVCNCCQQAPTALFLNEVLLHPHHHIISNRSSRNEKIHQDYKERARTKEIGTYHMFPFYRVIRFYDAFIKPIKAKSTEWGHHS